jgi:hypothetical protein
MADKRGAKRRIKRYSVVCSHELEKEMGISSDLSETGIFVKTRKHPESDSPIKIILKTESKMGIRLFFHAFIG